MSIALLAVLASVAAEPLQCVDDFLIEGEERAYIDAFGRDLPELGRDPDVRAAVQGDREAQSRVELRLESEWNIANVHLTTITYSSEESANKWRFATIDSWGSDAFRPAPSGPPPPDPNQLVSLWQQYEEVGWKLMRSGLIRPAKECGRPHCLFGFEHPDLRTFEARIADGVEDHEEAIGKVLHEDPAAERRAAAAFLLGNSHATAKTLSILTHAIRDPSSKVRNNALRVIGQILRRDSDIAAPKHLFDEALRLPTVTDRNKILVLLAERTANDSELARRMVAEHRDLFLNSVQLAQPNNRNAAVHVLNAASGKSFESCDSSRWVQWLGSNGHQ